MKILVTGSRHLDGDHSAFIWSVMGAEGFDILVHGDAPGADTIAATAGARWKRDVRPYPARWEEEGKAAGPRRNQRMLDEEHRPEEPIDLVLAFPDPGSRGTWDMIERAVKARIPVRVYVMDL